MVLCDSNIFISVFNGRQDTDHWCNSNYSPASLSLSQQQTAGTISNWPHYFCVFDTRVYPV